MVVVLHINATIQVDLLNSKYAQAIEIPCRQKDYKKTRKYMKEKIQANTIHVSANIYKQQITIMELCGYVGPCK